MPFESKKSRIFLFFAFGLGLALLMAVLKAAIAWAAHTYLYSVPWLGGFLRSIELLEISNLLVFAILGVGVGAATVWLPRRWPSRLKLAFLLLLSPFVFSSSYMMQQNLWIKEVAAKGNISYREARDTTNAYLQKEVGSSGFFGFYPFSTQLAELPTRLESLRSEQSVNPNELLSQELSSYDDPRADLAAYIFERIGWLMRFMYMTIAALTGLIYYYKGHSWAENRSPASAVPAGSPSNSSPSNSISSNNGTQKSSTSAVGSRPMRSPLAARKTPLAQKKGGPSQRPPMQSSSSPNRSGPKHLGPKSSNQKSINQNPFSPRPQTTRNLSGSSSSSGSLPSNPVSQPYANSSPDLPLSGSQAKPLNQPISQPINKPTSDSLNGVSPKPPIRPHTEPDSEPQS